MVVIYNNLFEILTDSYAPAVVLAKSQIKIYYSTLRHLVQNVITSPPFSNLKPGNVVSLSLPDPFDFITAFFATVAVCGISNPVDIRLSDADMEAHLKLVKPYLLIT